MRYLSVIGILVLTGFATNTVAQALSCNGAGYATQLIGNANAALSGMRVLATDPVSAEEWNEDHCPTGELYKIGAGTAVDPRALRGTWATTGTPPGQVTYNYNVTGSSTYTWSLWTDGTGHCWQTTTGAPTVVAIDPNAPGVAAPCP